MMKFLKDQKEKALNILNSDSIIHPVDVVVISDNPGYVDSLLKSINSQTVKINTLILVLNNYGSADTYKLQMGIVNYQSVKIIEGSPFNKLLLNTLLTTMVKSDCVAFFDGMDIYMPNYLKSQLAYLSINNSDVVYKTNVFGEHFNRPTFAGLVFDRVDKDTSTTACTTLVSKVPTLLNALTSLPDNSNNYLLSIRNVLVRTRSNIVQSDSFNYAHVFNRVDRLGTNKPFTALSVSVNTINLEL